MPILAACGPTPNGIDGGSPGSDAGAIDGGPSVEVGTGQNEFVALGVLDRIDIVLGPQGGYHVWGAVRVTGMNPSRIAVDLSVVLVGTPSETLSISPYRLTLLRVGSAYEWYGLLGFVPDPQRADGREVMLTMDVKDTAGRAGSDARRVIAKLP